MKQKWNCPHCDNSVVVHVELSQAPVCHNRSAHTSKQYNMVKESGNDRDS